MKKFIVLIACLALLGGGHLFAQESASHSSEHYSVVSRVGGDHAAKTADMLEAFFELFESYMHFDPEELSAPLRVRIFDSKQDYNEYLDSVIEEQRDSFVFIQYSDPAKSELVGFYEGDDDLYRRRLIHHGFVQYLKAFIPNPPLWLQKGFAVYFEGSQYKSSEKKAEFAHNYDWVTTLRTLLREAEQTEGDTRLIPVNSLLYLDSEAANKDLEAFYAQVWGTIEFLAHSEQEQYNRLLWDAISALSPDASQKENEQRVVDQAFSWVPREQLTEDYVEYVQGIKTFPELVRNGMDAYAGERLDKAQSAFKEALGLRKNHYVPYYYLGLINYDKGDYSMAEYYYQSALEAGGEAPLINYALGVNAYADNRLGDADRYLQKSLQAGDNYSDRVKKLQEKIKAQRGGSDGSGSDSGSNTTGESGKEEGQA
jgi:tetratricopeptide (TPR) repeat protein